MLSADFFQIIFFGTISTLINFLNNWVLPTPFSFTWVLKMLIGYSTFLINIYLGIFVNVKKFIIDTVCVLLLL